MAQLIVRNLDPDLVARLKRRAAELGCSAEEAHRQILRRALRDDDAFARRLREIPDVGDDADFERQRELPRELDL
ncbi:MAG: DNA-binding protein [Actinomycetota bacterium]